MIRTNYYFLGGNRCKVLVVAAIVAASLLLLVKPAEGRCSPDPCPGLPPSVHADNSSVTVHEGETATNTGTYSDPQDAGVTISADKGTVTQDANNQTWSWSYAPTDGPAQSGTVTITATTSDGRFSHATFSLTFLPGKNGKIAFMHSEGAFSEIYVMDADGSNQTNLTNNPAATDAEPSFSPDGKKIAFVRGSVISVMDADGSNQVNLANNADGFAYPSFSPDGKKIAFGSRRDGNGEIYVMNSDGTNQKNLTNTSSAIDSEPAFSPDGAKIAFTSYRDGDAEIYVMNSDGTNQTRLTNSTSDDRFPTFSPDGKKIAFASDPASTLTADYDVWLMNADGSNQSNLTNNATANNWDPTFSPDGKKIAFTSGNGIKVMNPDGTNQVSITNNGLTPAWGVVAAAAPSNDNFSSAKTISGATASVDATNTDATREPFDPSSFQESPTAPDQRALSHGHSVWYSWTAPWSGSTTIDTCTTNYDTLLGVYTGSALGSLTEVASDNNNCSSGWGSKLTFDAKAGTTYQIDVDGTGGAPQGNFTLNLSAPPPDTTPPTVTNVTPTDLATKVLRATNVEGTFSEAMDPNTLTTSTVQLFKGTSTTPLTAQVTASSDGKTVTLNPFPSNSTQKLAKRAKYHVTIKGGSGGAMDLAGNPLAADKVWTFTTGRR